MKAQNQTKTNDAAKPDKAGSNQSVVSTVGTLFFIVVGLAVGFLTPWTPDLSPLGHKVLMGLLLAIGVWIFRPLGIPYSIGGMVMLLVFLIFEVPVPVAFSGFTNSALWVLIPALYFGFALLKTGFGRRIAYHVIKIFQPSYLSLIFAWVVIGLVLSILTPSLSVRIVIVTPIALTVVEVCRLSWGSRGSSLILLTAWAAAVLPGAGWLTGSLHGPIQQGLFSSVPELRGVVTSSSWLEVMFLPIELSSLLTIVLGYFFLKPDEPISSSISRDVFEAEYEKLGPMSREEKLTGVILVAWFLLFATNQYHNLSDVAICLAGLIALFVAGVIVTKDLGVGIGWDIVLFAGIILGMGAVFGHAGVSQWLSTKIVPIVEPLTGSPWLFAPVVLTFLFLWRFLDVAVLVPTMLVILPAVPEIAQSFDIDPLMWLPLFVMAMNFFFLSYQNMFVLMAESMMGKKGWQPAHLRRYGLAYAIGCLLSLVAAIPYWVSQGFFG